MAKRNTIRHQTEECATLTPYQSTEITGFGVQATYKMLRAGTIPSIRSGKRFFIPRKALENWLESCGGSTGAAA